MDACLGLDVLGEGAVAVVFWVSSACEAGYSVANLQVLDAAADFLDHAGVVTSRNGSL